MRLLRLVLTLLFACCAVLAQQDTVRTTFKVKFVAEGAVYLDGGRAAGLGERMKLTVRRDTAFGIGQMGEPVAELEVLSVAETSSVCEVLNARSDPRAGDTAYLSAYDAQAVQLLRSGSSSRRYAQVVTFNEGDPLDEEERELIPHARPEEVNRIRGRLGFEYNSIHDRAGLNSYQTGIIFRGDLTRIGGSYWNLSGYTRGRFTFRKSGTGQETLNDLLNRTYTLTLYYENPGSRWTMGFGRMYLPWAASLNTIDGGYLGRRLGSRFTSAVFAGTSPDPTSWNYAPNRQIAGVLGNFSTGAFDSVRYSSTFGLALTRLNWRPERQFAFFENSIFVRRTFSVYHNLEVDRLPLAFRTGTGGQSGQGGRFQPSRSFLTLRLQPVPRLALDFSHNYFRNTPTFDPRLVATGLVDRLLFQGASAGVSVDLPARVAVYTSFGRSNREGDGRTALNQMYGLAKNDILGTGIRADIRYSIFDSSFGRGTYRTFSLSRQVGEKLRFEIQAGQQTVSSVFTDMNRARFINTNVDWFFTTHHFLGGGITSYRGGPQNYDQVYFNMGYRF
jgi:hypothetical protein